MKEECERALTEEVLNDLSRDLSKFWKSLRLKLKFPNANSDEIQADQVQYPSVKEKIISNLDGLVWQREISHIQRFVESIKGPRKGQTSEKTL